MTDEVISTEFPRKEGSSSGTATYWSVEARLASDIVEPISLGGQTITYKWKKVEFQITKEPHGVPQTPSFHGVREQENLLEYAAAQALRWNLHAQVEAFDVAGSLVFETRLVEHKITFSSSNTAVAAHQVIGGEDRSSIMPNWGAKIPVKPVGEEQS